MVFGLCTFLTDYSMGPVELARAAEEHGFESLFVPEHTHIPASRDTPYPGGTELPLEYSHTLDPFVALTAAAAATTTLKVGTGICLIIQRDPITTAKEIATLDRLSGGRFLFGVGAGWNREEMENHGTDPRRRFSLMRERVEAMKAIWSEEEAGYQGQHVNFDPVWSWPKPVHKPHPPVMIGGGGEKVLDRVISFGDGWLPQPLREKDLGGRMAELRRRAEEAGKDVAIVPFDHRSKPEFAEEMRQLGADGCVFWIPPEGRDETEARLDRIAERLGEFVGAAA
jgi:probable F420-dependent oxidoreductase